MASFIKARWLVSAYCPDLSTVRLLRAVALIGIPDAIDFADVEVLMPGRAGNLCARLKTACRGCRSGAWNRQGLGKNPAIHWFRRFDPEQMQNCWRNVHVSAWDRVSRPTTEMGPC